MSYRWLSKKTVLAIHSEQIATHGGLSAIRDEGLLESALARPINLFEYEQADLATCAAAYGFEIVKNHPFNDGNKRTGFLVAVTFLMLNGHYLSASEPDVVITITKMAAGKLNQDEFQDWLMEHLVELK